MFLEIPNTPFTEAFRGTKSFPDRNYHGLGNKVANNASAPGIVSNVDLYADSSSLACLPRCGGANFGQENKNFRTNQSIAWCVIVGLTESQWSRYESLFDNAVGPIIDKITSNSNFLYLSLLNSSKVDELIELCSNSNFLPRNLTISVQKAKYSDVQLEKQSQTSAQFFPEFESSKGATVAINQHQSLQNPPTESDWLLQKLSKRIFSHFE
eukprot:GHVP01061629.1.p1 GENE.GHVP01061629.1~~GHVP01061629.1.p1  ORF type:complete len:211 (+),score=30.77 GHVP01061629.1:26-658(+)